MLEQFTYVMPQTYDHGGNGIDFADARWLANQLGGSYERIVYGLDSEPAVLSPEKPDNPRKFAAQAKRNHAAGIFAWRLDNDSADRVPHVRRCYRNVEIDAHSGFPHSKRL